MTRFFCNGKNGYCNRGNDNNIDCTSCEFASGTGGEFVDCPDTNFERIKAMNVEEMANFIDIISRCGETACKDCVLSPEDCGSVKNIEEWLMKEVKNEL